jgi:hypothetical protein
MPSTCARIVGLRSRCIIRGGALSSARPIAACSVCRMVACNCGESSAMFSAITIDTTSETTPMMMNCDCQLPNSGSVIPAIAADRKLAPTGPQVQNPNAVARPIRGEKSRTSGAVQATAMPSTKYSATRTTSSSVGLDTSAMAKHRMAVTSMAGTSGVTRPTLSASRPASTPDTAPASAAAAEMAP